MLLLKPSPPQLTSASTRETQSLMDHHNKSLRHLVSSCAHSHNRKPTKTTFLKKPGFNPKNPKPNKTLFKNPDAFQPWQKVVKDRAASDVLLWREVIILMTIPPASDLKSCLLMLRVFIILRRSRVFDSPGLRAELSRRLLDLDGVSSSRPWQPTSLQTPAVIHCSYNRELYSWVAISSHETAYMIPRQHSRMPDHTHGTNFIINWDLLRTLHLLKTSQDTLFNSVSTNLRLYRLSYCTTIASFNCISEHKVTVFPEWTRWV